VGIWPLYIHIRGVTFQLQDAKDSLIATTAIIPTAIIQYVIKPGRFQPRATVGEEIEAAEEIEVGDVTGASDNDVGRSR